jgi:hypothetical protein
MQTAQQPNPALAAHIDWMKQGQFNPEQFDGEQRRLYEQEAARIEQQWDHQPE